MTPTQCLPWGLVSFYHWWFGLFCSRRWRSRRKGSKRRFDRSQRPGPHGFTSALLPWYLIVCNTRIHTDKVISIVFFWVRYLLFPSFLGLGGLQVTKEQKEEQFHFLVFTDVFGNKTHGVVMQCYRPILVHTDTHCTVFWWQQRDH